MRETVINKNEAIGSNLKNTYKVNWLKEFTKSLQQNKTLYLFLIPVLVYLLVIKYLPMLGTVIAFQDFKFSKGIFHSDWIGWDNFVKLFKSPDFYSVLVNTLLLNLYNIVIGFPVPIFLAVMLNEVRMVGFKKVVQSILYVPYFISWVVLGGIVISMFSVNGGIVNVILGKMGIEPIFFMKDSIWWIIIYIFSGIWQSAGWGTIIYLAAISGIDQEMYEAAQIDGANRLQRILHITLPSIKSTIAVLLILRMGKMMEVGFEQIYILQNDAIRSISEVFSTFEYRIGIQGMDYSYTTAIGLFKGLVGLVLILLTDRIIRALGEEGLW